MTKSLIHLFLLKKYLSHLASIRNLYNSCKCFSGVQTRNIGMKWVYMNLGTNNITLPCTTTQNGKTHFKNLADLLQDLYKVSNNFVTPWCNAYHYCISSFNKAWPQVLRRFKSYSQRVGDSRWWGSLKMVRAGNKVERLSSVNHTTKTIHRLHHHAFKC